MCSELEEEVMHCGVAIVCDGKLFFHDYFCGHCWVRMMYWMGFQSYREPAVVMFHFQFQSDPTFDTSEKSMYPRNGLNHKIRT